MRSYHGKYIDVGIGVSTNKSGYKAAKEAAQMAVKECGKRPTFSIVYVDSKYNPKEVLKGINEVMKKDSWIGISADKQFNHIDGHIEDKAVSVLTIASDYLHFGVGVAENYRENPYDSAIKAIATAMKNVKVDKYVDAYIQFSRIKKSNYSRIVRTPPYFVLTFISGAKLIRGRAIPGKESEFINGILSYTRPNIPIFGGSASSSFEDYIYKNRGDNFQFANGKVYSDAAIVVFVISNLMFVTDVDHGYVATDKFAALTKVSKDGYEIFEINGRPAVDEYARLLGISKKEYLKDPSKYSLTRPFGLVDIHGQVFIREALPNPDGKSLHSTFKVEQNSVMNITKYEKKKTFSTLRHILEENLKDKKSKPAISLFCSCSGRRPLLDGKENKVVEDARAKFKGVPMFGFYSFGEVGSTKTVSALAHSQTITSLIIFDKLLAED